MTGIAGADAFVTSSGTICSVTWGSFAIAAVGELLAHDLAAAQHAQQHGLVDDRPQLRRVLAVQQLGPALAQFDPASDLARGCVRQAAPDHGIGVGLGLQQTGDVLDLEGTDGRRGLLKADQAVEPLGHQALVVPLPPARFARSLQQLEQDRGLVRIGVVVLQQRPDVGLRGRPAALARLDARELRGAEAERACGLVLGEAGILAEARQLHADEHLQQGRSRLGPIQIGFETGDAMRRGGHPDSQQTGRLEGKTISSPRCPPHPPAEIG